jgi:hypothetical protein
MTDRLDFSLMVREFPQFRPRLLMAPQAFTCPEAEIAHEQILQSRLAERLAFQHCELLRGQTYCGGLLHLDHQKIDSVCPALMHDDIRPDMLVPLS